MTSRGQRKQRLLSVIEAASDLTLEEIGQPEIRANIDTVLSSGQLVGWAYSPLRDLELAVRIDGAEVGAFTGQAYRADVEAAGIGDGRCGFEWTIPRHCFDGSDHELSLHVVGNDAPVAVKTLPLQLYNYVVEQWDEAGNIRGWARDPRDSIYRLEMCLVVDGTEVSRDVANRFRVDLANAGLDDGAYGFELSIPGSLCDGCVHEFELVARGLAGSVTLVKEKRALFQPVRSVAWPYAGPPLPRAPACMPDGRHWPRISIVTPSFNQGRFLEETILSVIEQGYPDYEHIVIDGGSTDETRDVLERHRHHLTYVVSEPDGGQSAAIDRGFKRASGDILTWLNSDDMLAPGALFAAALALARSKADVVAGICQVHRGGVIVHEHLTAAADGPLAIEEVLDLEQCWLAGQFFYQPEVLFTREIYERAGGFIDEKLHYSMDFDLWARFANAGARLHVIGRPIALFRAHAEQKTAGGRYLGELKLHAERLRDSMKVAPRKPDTGKRVDKLRIVFVNDVGFKAGAGIAHRRLAAACALAGHDVIPFAIDPDYCRLPLSRAAELLPMIREAQPDLIVVGNIHCAQEDASLLMLMAGIAPTVAVMHDLWLVTGRCAYTRGCDKLLDGCDERCPTPDEYPQLPPDRIASAWVQKRELFRLPTFHAASGSQWLLDQAERTGVLIDARRQWFGYGLDTSLFAPGDRSLLRKELGLPEMAFIVIVAAVELNERRKGLVHLLDALERLRERGILLVCIGVRPPPGSIEHARLAQFEPIYTGYLEDERLLARYLAAADVFVGPSLEEAFGQVFIEAAACGTPSIGFRIGGVTEALKQGVTGYIAEETSGEALACALHDAIVNKRQREAIGVFGRMDAESRYSLEALYARFLTFLRRNRVLPRVALPRKISFDRQRALPTLRVMRDSTVWEPVEGVLKRSSRDPAFRLDGVYYWLTERARLEIRPPLGFPCLVAMRVRNFLEGQTLRVVHGCDGTVSCPVPVTEHKTDHLLQFVATAPTLVIESAVSQPEGENRLGVLLLDLAVC